MVVPNRLKEIPLNVLHSYNQRMNSQKQNVTLEHNEYEIDSKRSFGKKYLKQVFLKIFQYCRNAENNLLFHDVVNEKYLAHFE